MQVFKFGGASVKDAAGVRNLIEIVRTKGPDAVVVVSAMGKTTNALEAIVRAFAAGQTDQLRSAVQHLRAYHEAIVHDLSGDFTGVRQLFDQLDHELAQSPTTAYDELYDQIVSFGELLSTRIIADFAAKSGLNARWVDARHLIRTDDTFREGRVDWTETTQRITEMLAVPNGLVITQGFIGQTADGRTTTLGREGSDYTAAILAYCLDAERVTIWKDVPGVLNADPKYFDDTVLLETLTYQDAIELAYYGATVIHPKTIKPLQNKGIPLAVRSFVHPDAPGTVIGEVQQQLTVPSFIFKIDQVLISLHPTDFSFIAEDNLSRIFGRFAGAGVKINLMQNTAISFSVVIDANPDRLPALLDALRENFRISYNEGLELITIRHHDSATINRVLVDKTLLLEQKSRYTAQLVVRSTI